MELIIVGGGAAGLFLAAELPEFYQGKTLLLDQNSLLGAKLLLSGGGMCNLTNIHPPKTFLKHFGTRTQERFLTPALMNFTPEDCRQWFEQRGLPLTIRNDGKVFPQTLKASSLVDLLRAEAASKQVEVRRNEKIVSLNIEEGCFILNTAQGQSISGKRLVLCTGGKSFPSTGSDGSGYELARSLGHKIVEPTQALVGIHIESYPFHHLAGNSLKNIRVDFIHEGESKAYLKTRGDLLFTHQGLSGPVVLNHARDIRKNDTLSCSLIPVENKEEARGQLHQQLISQKNAPVFSVLKRMGLTKSLNRSLFNFLELQPQLKCGELSKKSRNRLLSHLLDFPFKVSRKGSFSSAMATAGGVVLSEVNRANMESRLHSNLFFAGEILDIDGETGGYNIQAAFSMAALICKTLKNMEFI